MSSKSNDEERLMHSKRDNIEIIINDKTEEVIKEYFESHLSRYQISLETTTITSNFIFDCIDLLYNLL